jgi:acyl-lipid omega-6 desaturase (Delta-12 desaturase)
LERPLLTAGPMISVDNLRAYTRESRPRGWFALLTTQGLLLASAVGAAGPLPWPVRVLASLIEALLIVRLFVLFHDVLHGAILRGSRLAKVLCAPFAWLVLTPTRVWRETHNYHHAHTAKLVGSHVGSFATTTPGIYASLSRRARWLYLAQRHPLNIALAAFTIFGFGMCLLPFVRAPRKNAEAGVALVASLGLFIGLWLWGGPAMAILAYGGPAVGACSLGAYLFYAQHNCPGIVLQPRHEWSNTRAALESSSHMRMGPVMAYFTANIGYHHLHHLNPAVPFYRLPELSRAHPELRPTAVTSLAPRDVWACLRLKFWNPVEGRLVPR